MFEILIIDSPKNSIDMFGICCQTLLNYALLKMYCRRVTSYGFVIFHMKGINKDQIFYINIIIICYTIFFIFPF